MEGKRGVVVVFARSAPLFPRISSSGEALRDYSCCGVASVFAGPLGTRSARRHFELATFLFLFRHPVCRERG